MKVAEAMKPDPSKAAVAIDDLQDGRGLCLCLSGDWRNTGLGTLPGRRGGLTDKTDGVTRIDLDGVTAMDTAGAWLIRRFITENAGPDGFVLTGGKASMRKLIETLPAKVESPAVKTVHRPLPERLLAPVGMAMTGLWHDVTSMMFVLGSAVKGAQAKQGRRGRISPAAVVNQIDCMGVRAMAIIVLMSFLIGAIIAQQGAFQLRYFGAEIFVVDLVGILQLREIGVLMTAIMVAGRSGSAIAAEIGAMKMREEVDALKVIGLNPVGVLVFPRLIALAIVLPLLTVIANLSALGGAALVAWAYSGIPFAVFSERLHAAVDYSTLASGMIKTPFIALIIGAVSAAEGMKVGGSAESLGRHVTAAVVKSIFIVILVDGLFAVFYAAIGF